MPAGQAENPGMTWLAFASVTVIAWGVYGVFLNTGQMLMADPAGKLERFTTKVAVAAVMLPAESFVVTSVIDTLPVTTDSELLTGGTSLAGDSAAVNVGLVGVVDEGDVEELQPTAARASATAMRDKRVIVRSPSPLDQ